MSDEIPVTPEDAIESGQDKAESPNADQIRYKGADGKWHELKARKKNTGDPELDEIWAMSFEDFNHILEDESHPLHEKAKQVSAEMMEPFRQFARQAVKPFSDSFREALKVTRPDSSLLKVDTRSFFPHLDTSSWTAKLLPDRSEGPPSQSLPNRLNPNPTTSPLRADSVSRSIDFDAPDPPDASPAEIQEAAEEHANELRNRQIEILTALLSETQSYATSGKDALEISKEALKATKDSVNHARGSKHAAWVAAAAAAAGIVVAIVLDALS